MTVQEKSPQDQSKQERIERIEKIEMSADAVF